jgi:hypothetical protein
MQRTLCSVVVLLLTACERAPGDAPRDDSPAVPASRGASSAVPSAAASSPAPAAAVAPKLLAEPLILAEWAKADNRARCAPIAFADDGGMGGAPRRAIFAGGWAIAFDLPGKRSAYGVAGAGSLPEDEASKAEQRRRLTDQWPLFRDLADLPQPAFAGYGIEGAKAYFADDPQGLNANSLAYVRIGGQTCLYNVWSRLGREHVELLLDNLRMVRRVAD